MANFEWVLTEPCNSIRRCIIGLESIQVLLQRCEWGSRIVRLYINKKSSILILRTNQYFDSKVRLIKLEDSLSAKALPILCKRLYVAQELIFAWVFSCKCINNSMLNDLLHGYVSIISLLFRIEHVLFEIEPSSPNYMKWWKSILLPLGLYILLQWSELHLREDDLSTSKSLLLIYR